MPTKDEVEQIMTESAAALRMPRPPIEWTNKPAKLLPPVCYWVDGFRIDEEALHGFSADELRFGILEALAIHETSGKFQRLATIPLWPLAILVVGLFVWRSWSPQVWHWSAIITGIALCVAYCTWLGVYGSTHMARWADKRVFAVFRRVAPAESYLKKIWELKAAGIPRVFQPTPKQRLSRIEQVRRSARQAGVMV